MIDINKRKELINPTVGDVIAALQQLPKEANFFTCGTNKMYIHVDTKDNAVILDSESFDEGYEQELEEERFEGNSNDYVTCSTYGDYSPSNPWDAPGCSISDFIRC